MRASSAHLYMYGAPFLKILYLTDLAQKLLSLRIFSYLCAEIKSLRAFSYICTHLAISARIQMCVANVTFGQERLTEQFLSIHFFYDSVIFLAKQ